MPNAIGVLEYERLHLSNGLRREVFPPRQLFIFEKWRGASLKSDALTWSLVQVRDFFSEQLSEGPPKAGRQKQSKNNFCKNSTFLKVSAKTDITMFFSALFYVDCTGRN